MRIHHWIVRIASRLVPRASREEWRAEWDAELPHRESTTARWPHGGRRDLFRRSAGAFRDALWMRSHRWYSLRLFARHWRLATAAVASLGFALAATTIALSAWNALLVRAPAAKDPGRLRFIHVR